VLNQAARLAKRQDGFGQKWGTVRLAPWVVAAVAFLATVACSPSIAFFHAEPRTICPESPVTLTWQATTSGIISGSSPVAGIGAVSASGWRRIVPRQSTILRLDVGTAFGSASRENGVDVLNIDNASKVIGQSIADPSAACDASGVSVTATAPADFWDPHLRVDRVASTDGRTYSVEHGGVSAAVTPDAASTAFSGQPVSGIWKLISALRPGEACGPNLPNNLMVTVFPSCPP
jgi:hypothetical protein